MSATPFAARLPVVDWAPAPRNAPRQRPGPLSPTCLRFPPRTLPVPCVSPIPCPRALRARSLVGGRTDSQGRMDLSHHAARMVNEALRQVRPVPLDPQSPMPERPGLLPAMIPSSLPMTPHRLPAMIPAPRPGPSRSLCRLPVPRRPQPIFSRSRSPSPARAPCGRALPAAGARIPTLTRRLLIRCQG
jgi:hypothetical protein